MNHEIVSMFVLIFVVEYKPYASIPFVCECHMLLKTTETTVLMVKLNT